MKNKTTALILSIFVGGLGIDRFYLGYTGMGILKLLTGGCFGILWIIDLIRIATGSLKPADGSNYSNEIDNSIYTKEQQENNTFENLKKLGELHKSGVINEEEFNKLKNDLLKKV